MKIAIAAFLLLFASAARADLSTFIDICESPSVQSRTANTLDALRKMVRSGFHAKRSTCTELGDALLKRTKIDLPGKTFHYYRVQDADVLAQLDWITELNIAGQELRDLGPLGNLTKLKRLDISGISTDLTFLGLLRNLEGLKLSAGPASALDVVSLLPLQTLEIAAEKGTHIRVLPFSIRSLTLSGRGIADLSGIQRLGLEELNIHTFTAENFEFLKGSHRSLRRATFRGANVEDLSALGDCIALEELEYSSSRLRSIDFASKLTQLKRLNLTYNDIDDPTPLGNLTSLLELDLTNNAISDAKPLRNLFRLQKLEMPYNRLYSFGLGFLERLKVLNLTNNSLNHTFLADVEDATYRLEELYLSTNQLRSPDASLGKLPRLRVVSLNDNKLRTVEGLEKAKNLEVLYLQDNKLTDVSVLSPLTRLTSLTLYDNPLPSPVQCPVLPASICR